MDVDGENLLSRKTIEHWISTSEKQKAKSILVRNALRSLPSAAAIARLLASSKKKEARLERFVLTYLRLLLSIADSYQFDNVSLLRRVMASFDEMVELETGEHRFRFEVLREVVHCATGEHDWKSSTHASVGRLNSYFRGAAAADGELRDSASEQLLEALKHDFGAREVFDTKLWPSEFETAISRAEQFFAFSKSAFGIDWFQNWYQGFLDGNPLDWELQRRVALIPDAIWEAGPEAVGREIARIRAQYALELEIATLKERLEAAVALDPPAHRLHNQPPEAIADEAQAVRREITLVWDEIVELDAEIAKPAPSPSKLNRIAQTLWDISVRVGKYCASVADIMIREAAKEVSKTGTKVAVAAIAATTAAQNESIQSVAKAIWEFVKTLPPG